MKPIEGVVVDYDDLPLMAMRGCWDYFEAYYKSIEWDDQAIKEVFECVLDSNPKLQICEHCHRIDYNHGGEREAACRYCYRDRCLSEIAEDKHRNDTNKWLEKA